MNADMVTPFCHRYARIVNQLFSMTSIGTQRTGFEANPAAGFVNFTRGIGNTRMHGQSYHRCLPGNYSGGIEYYLYDRAYAKRRASMPSAIPRRQIDGLRRMLFRENPLVQSIRSMATVDAPTATLVLRHNVNTDELAAYTLEENGDDHIRARDIVFHRNTDAEPTFLNVGSGLYDTLQFPLLHPYGGTTWHFGRRVNRHKITLAEYTKYLHMQDPGDRLCRLGRLTEEILLDNNSRILEERLNFVRHNAGFRKRVASIAAVRSPQNAAQRVGTVYLPACTPGSPKYQKRLVEQALTVVQKLGQPTYFVTFTCNPKWPEIQENLRPGQISSDRPLLVARVFKLKLASLLKTIQKWDGGCEYYFCTVEFQHRGLPHAHIALKVKNPPSFGSNMQHIQVNMPEASDNRYRQLVGTHMTHGCRRRFADEQTGVKEPRDCLRHKTKRNVLLRKCSKGYPKPYVSMAYTTDTGYPVYARRPPADVDEPLRTDNSEASRTKAEIMKAKPDLSFDEICRRVVPHSRQLIELFESHINVEWAHSVEIINYLYKYIYKHESTAWIGIMKEGDQVQRFMNAQRVSSSEAAWNILRFQVNMRSHAIDTVHVHCPGDNWIIYNEADDIVDEQTYREHVAEMTISKLERYLNRPAAHEFDDVKLDQYYERYKVCKWSAIPAYARNTFWTDRYDAGRRMVVYRLRGANHFVYIPRCTPAQGQLFYLRMLLCNIPARSWLDLRTDQTGTVHRTFEEAARARGLLNGLDEYEFLFEDYAMSAAAGIVTPEKLQQLFVMCTTQDEFPANVMWMKHKALMCKSVRNRYLATRVDRRLVDEMAENKVLTSLDEHLISMGSSLSKYDLPQPRLG